MDEATITAEVKKYWPELIKAINRFDHLKVTEFLKKKELELLFCTDAYQSNSLMHFAAAAHNIDLLLKLYHASPYLALLKNLSEELPVDWLRDYAYARLHLMIAPEKLKQVPKAVFEGNFSAIKELLVEEKMPVKLRFSLGRTVLHLAIQYAQPQIVQLVLENTDDTFIEQLLKMKNVDGGTALDMAQQLQLQQDGIKEKIINLLQDAQQHATEATGNRQAAVPPTTHALISIDLSKVDTLAQLLTGEVKESDCAQLNDHLPTLCSLAYLSCQQAISLLKLLESACPFECTSEYKQAEALLKSLFGLDYNVKIGKHLQQKIMAIANYLADLIHSQRIHQSITVSIRDPLDLYGPYIPRGGTVFAENKINLYPNATGKTNLAVFVATLLHECSHLVNHDCDLAYNQIILQDDGSYNINLQRSFQLATQLGFAQKTTSEYIKPENLKLLAALIKLEHSPWGIGVSHGLKNADTIMAAIKGLAAIQSGQATLNKRILSIDGAFLSASSLEAQKSLLFPWVTLIDSRVIAAENALYKSQPGSPTITESTSAGSDKASDEGFSEVSPTEVGSCSKLKESIVGSPEADNHFGNLLTAFTMDGTACKHDILPAVQPG